jgi:hypothetical protein
MGSFAEPSIQGKQIINSGTTMIGADYIQQMSHIPRCHQMFALPAML